MAAINGRQTRQPLCSHATRLACANYFFFSVCENNLHKLLSRMWAKNTEAICRIVCPMRSGFEPNSGQNEWCSVIHLTRRVAAAELYCHCGFWVKGNKKKPKTIRISHVFQAILKYFKVFAVEQKITKGKWKKRWLIGKYQLVYF